MKKAKADHQTLDKPNFDLVRRFAMQLPHVEEGTIHGAPSWKLNGKLLACPPIHKSAEPIPFTRESWCGRIRAWRRIGATLSPGEVEAFDAAHQELLRQTVPDSFTVLRRLDAHLFAFKARD